jgi:hypothetical protein
MTDVRSNEDTSVGRFWGWVAIAGAVVCGALGYALVFVVTGNSDGYSCGTLLRPTEFGGRANYGDGGCGYQIRTGWTSVLVLLSVAAILAALGVGLVVRARVRRRSSP